MTGTSARRQRQDTLEQLVAAGALTEAGKKFVIRALDPYHDKQVSPDGIPDECTSRVVVQEVKQSVQIKAPLGVTGNWSVMISTMPELNNLPNTGDAAYYARMCRIDSNGLIVGTDEYYPWAPVMVVSGPDGVPLTPTDGYDSTLIEHHPMHLNEYFDGQKRLIAQAFEVHNTTAEIYRQGTCTVGRLPQVVSDSYAATKVTAAQETWQPMFSKVSRLPPPDISTALLLGGSAQWEASLGCYCVATQDVGRNDLSGSTMAGRMFTEGDWGGSQETLAKVSATASIGSQPTEFGGQFTQLACKPTPFHSSFAFFTGLSPQTTLTINCLHILETAPTPENRQLVVLTKPSPSYDPLALELYKRMAVELPVGVPVDQNASGDFWDTVMGGISKVAGPLASLIPLPGAGLIGTLAGGALEAGRKARLANEASNEKQKAKPVAPKTVRNPSEGKTDTLNFKMKARQK